jgi:hypothetical protein
MGMFDWLSFENGKARFCGQERGADEAPHYVLAVQLDNLPIHFGNFQPQFEKDKTHYDVEIVSFGFHTPSNVGNPNVTARAVFSPAEVRLVQTLIRNLILWPEEKPVPLKNRSSFRGGVHFRNDWIRQKPAE